VTVQSVVQEVCSFVGVRPPNSSIFVSPYQDRTAWEFVNLANEMAQRIAYDTRDWQGLRKLCVFNGAEFLDPKDNVMKLMPSFPLPSDYQRMLLTANVWRSTNLVSPLMFVSDPDDWIKGGFLGYYDPGVGLAIDGTGMPSGQWMIENDEMFIRPELAVGETVQFYYLRNTPVRLYAGGFGTEFVNDADVFALPERLLKLGLIWQWKANKGATYAEDLANYEDALSRVAGNDKPSPIIIG
jgi:hypothetical protein